MWQADSNNTLILKPVANQILISPEILVNANHCEPCINEESSSWYWRKELRFPLHALAVLDSSDTLVILDLLMGIPKSQFKKHFSPKRDISEMGIPIKVVNKLGASRYFYSGLPIHIAAFCGNYRAVLFLKKITSKNKQKNAVCITAADKNSPTRFWSLKECARASGDYTTKMLFT
jgi:hypothetical protein